MDFIQTGRLYITLNRRNSHKIKPKDFHSEKNKKNKDTRIKSTQINSMGKHLPSKAQNPPTHSSLALWKGG